MAPSPAGSRPEVSDDAVVKATGRDWSTWTELLDDWGAMDHARRAARLQDEGLSGWWAQTVAVGYERIRGLRVPGQRSDGTFQVSRQRTVTGSALAVWDALLDRLAADGHWMVGRAVGLRDGAKASVRILDPARRLRFQRQGGEMRSVVDITLETREENVVLRVQETGLPDATARDRSQDRCTALLDAVEQDLETD